jgi:hypothetical protein
MLKLDALPSLVLLLFFSTARRKSQLQYRYLMEVMPKKKDRLALGAS